MDDDIDIVGVNGDKEESEEHKEEDDKTKSKLKNGMYGPDQFTEEDVLEVAKELEKEDPADNDITDAVDDDEDCQKKWCSQCQVRSSFESFENPNLYDHDVGQSPCCRGLSSVLACSLSKVLAHSLGKYCLIPISIYPCLKL